MTMESKFKYIRDYYNLPFLRLGMSVRHEGSLGRVVGVRGSYLRVRFPSIKGDRIGNYHPTWEMAYLDADGKELANFEGEK